MSSGIEKIIAEIEKSAAQESEAVLSEARKRADRVLAEARAEALRRERAVLLKGEQEANQEAQRIVAEARIRARRAEIDAREKVLQQALDQAQQMLQAMTAQGAAYKAALERLTYAAAISSGAEALEILMSQRDRQLLSQDDLRGIAARISSEQGIAARLTCAQESLDCRGGVVLRSADGRVRVDNTFEARLDRLRHALRTEAARLLFQEASADE